VAQTMVVDAAFPTAAFPESPYADPVFVLCNGRSGSTLLRFLLDAHPDLACPPETNMPALCGQLATMWSLIEGAPLPANRGDEQLEIPEAAVAGVRKTMDLMTGSYLARRGKKRYCDKSLGTARFAKLLLRIYPEARFVCLYRHPMDVIASGLEACPWGLSGYGFDPYITSTPGNAVFALARFWADSAAAILAVEEQFPDRCVRVRYEDLVADPEQTADAIFRFLDAPAVPGISTACFSADRERFGQGDHKIWYTSSISRDSVGRGWSIPPALIEPAALSAINELAGKLHYVPVDGGWGTSAPPADLRLAAGIPRPGASDARSWQERGPEDSRALGERLRAGLRQAGGRIEACSPETMVTVWVPADPAQPAEHWLVDLSAGTVTFVSQAAQEKSDWDIIGSAAAWDQVMAGKLNLSAALRSYQLRYCDNEESHDPLAMDRRIALLGSLLALANW
jgi:Sulfotransferase family/SCP-2 sterol transfer family